MQDVLPCLETHVHFAVGTCIVIVNGNVDVWTVHVDILAAASTGR